MNADVSIFREYDIRGTYPEQLNEETILLIAVRTQRSTKPKIVSLTRKLKNQDLNLMNIARTKTSTKIQY